jgi:hypothetical protein
MIRLASRVVSVAALALGASVVMAGTSNVALNAADAPQGVPFECTGGAQSWVVPAGVTSATFDVFGAQGGVGDDGQVDPFRASSDAGLGGHTTATIPVTPGETIQINVGCAGADSTGSASPGGFGGSPGGNGGIGGDLASGGGGGGSSDVRQGGTTLTNRVVVAGGGGGSGGANGETTDGEGGAGGGTAGVAGGGTANANGGEPGTQAANGAGGTLPIECESDSDEGQDGTDANGGDGGTDPAFGAGGGGGGGYRSGGGGAGCVNGGGGGGGAGFAMVGATGVANEVGVRSGDGHVLVTFTVVVPVPVPVVAPIVNIQPAFTG